MTPIDYFQEDAMKLRVQFMLIVLAVACFAASLTVYGQISSAAPLSGTITDPTGAVVPGASVVVKNDATSATFNTTTVSNGTFVVPALNPGTYTVTVTATGFKQAIVREVKIDAGTPASVQISLEVGAATETVTVQGGGDIVQTQTAAVSTTIVGRQITELPLPWRDASNLALLLPGANTPTTVRSTTFLGLPPNAVNLMIDGINIQEQLFRNNNDFFSYVSPRVDAIEEVSISTAAATADTSGQGAVQIKFVTRQGGNELHGSLYEYHRNTALNANYWFNNRNLAPVDDETHLPCATYDPRRCHAPRNRSILHQFGGRVGGPITLPKFFGPFGFDGRNKAFFFVNVENYSFPVQNTRTRTIFHPLTQTGVFRYNFTSGGVTTVREVNLLQLAAAKGQTSTIDPTIGKLLSDIRATTAGKEGDVRQLANPNLQQFSFLSPAKDHHVYPTVRFDFNLTSQHHLEYIGNIQQWRRFKDNVNSADPRFPGFPNFGDTTSTRFSHSAALRSTLSPVLVNEFRIGLQGGKLHFFENATRDTFTGPVANQNGFNLGTGGTTGIGVAGIDGPNRTAAPSSRNSPIWTFADNLTWQRGAHSLAFGTTFTSVASYENNKITVPTITFGVDTTNDPARILFDATNGPVNFPGASNADITAARNIYAVLTGRVTAISGTAWLDEETGKYVYNGDNIRRARQRELGLYAQDSWRWRPNLTLNYGVRWQVQFPFTPLNNKFSTTTLADLFGVSGLGNLFKPGTLQGKETEFVQYQRGDRPYPTNYKNFAPSVGFAWSPNLGRGALKLLFGDAGKTVLRGGYSIAFIQPSIASFTGVFNGNPGGFTNATRNVTNGNLVSGSGNDTWPLLFRQRERLGPPSFPEAPVYPLKGLVTDSAAIFGPDVRIPYVQSWNFSLQREIGRDMAIEFRYVSNFNLQNLTSFNLNETDIIANGFLNEFKLAQANLQANIAAGRGNTFRYFGPGTGTFPLPIYLAYFSGRPASEAGNPARYNSTNFTNASFVNALALHNPNPYTPASAATNEGLFGNATLRQNALNAGLPANFFRANPGLNNAQFTGNGGFNRYDSGVVEFRRRLSKGLLVQSSYTFAKGYDSQFISLRKTLESTPRAIIAHTFRANWIYELPFGSGKAFLNGSGKALDRIVGGWEFHGVARTQSGVPFSLGNVQLVGMTRKELQDAIRLRFNNTRTPNVVFLLPQDIIDNTVRAFNVSATSATGYSTRGVPTGRYIAPANSATCIQVFTGDCGFTDLVVHGTPFTRFDLSVVKKTKIKESVNFELRAEFLNAFNHINFTTNSFTQVGGFTSDNFGQIDRAYQDTANTNETGGRMIQIVLRFNF
jgi:hypothetical protein